MEITLETEETIIVRLQSQTLAAFCPECRATVEMALPHTAADFSGSSEREIFRLIEAGKIHFTENGRILICLDSLNFYKGEEKK